MILLAIALTFLFSHLSFAWPGRVLVVFNGDMLVVSGGYNDEYTIRLYGIDCPEPGQEFYDEATAFIQTMTEGLFVYVDIAELDLSGSWMSKVYLPDGSCLNEKLVEAGLDWVREDCTDCGSLRALQEKARAGRKGIWSVASPVPPWEFRKVAK